MKILLPLLLLTLLTFTTKSQPVEYGDTTIVELITFESTTDYLLQATPTTNLWQVGQPSKTTFSSSYSGNNAMVTDTLNQYPANNHSWFDIAVPLVGPLFLNVGMGFYHKLQTEPGTDGGYITVSYDDGKTWNNILNDTLCTFMFYPASSVYPNKNLYSQNDVLFNGENGFSGTISDWQYVEFYWIINMVTKSANIADRLLVRFNFVSDEINNSADGWMIDNIAIFYNHWVGSVSDQGYGHNLTLYPNPVNQLASISTKNGQNIISANLYALKGQLLRHETVQSHEYKFQKGSLEPGVYFIRCTFENASVETLKLVVSE